MGWFDYPDDKELLYSDDGLDRIDEFMHKLSSSYEKALGRKVKVEEVRRLLELYLRTNNGDFFQDYDDKNITEVKFKLAKVKKQKDLQVGDVFAIPLNNGLFGFGRTLLLSDGENIFEYFSYTSKYKIYTEDIIKSSRVYYSHLYPKMITDGIFTIIHKDANFQPKGLDELKFKVHYKHKLSYIYTGEIVTAAKYDMSDDEMEKLPDTGGLTVGILTKILEAKLPLSKG